jgi:putative copper resistance protein D
VTIAIRFGSYLDLMLLFGIAAFALPLRVRTARMEVPGWSLAGGAAIGLLLAAAGVASLAASMSGIALLDVDLGAVGTVLSVPAIGGSIAVRVGALLVVLVEGLAPFPAALRGWMIVVASGVALASLSWIGHGNMDGGALGWLHLIATMLHLLAAALWIGAIAGLLAMVAAALRSPTGERLERSWRALAGFARTGTILVGTIVLTGAINGWAIVGPANVPALPTTAYGRLLIAKLILFAAMLALAARNRFRHVPHLRGAIDGGQPSAALRRLRYSLAMEALCGVAVLIAVAWLGTLDPGGGG